MCGWYFVYCLAGSLWRAALERPEEQLGDEFVGMLPVRNLIDARAIGFVAEMTY